MTSKEVLLSQSQVASDDLARRLKVHGVNSALRDEYGSNRSREPRHPTDCLIATILSQHTTDRNSGAAYRNLQSHFPTWDKVLNSGTAELADTIRIAGLANIKAARVQDTLQALWDRFGSLDLDFLKRLPMEDAREVLLSLPGVGPKTAACVLLFSCGHPALPVDTHVHRLAQRLGLVAQKVSAERAQEELGMMVPLSDVYDFHVNLIAHGRRVCHARNPNCDGCVLQSECSHFKRCKSDTMYEDEPQPLAASKIQKQRRRIESRADLVTGALRAVPSRCS